MKRSIAALAFPCILAASSPPGILSGAPKVTVCVEEGAGIDGLDRAELSAGKILALIGLRIDWRNRRRSCPPELDAILVNLTIKTPRDYFPRAYGISYPFEGIHIRVFYDRIRLVQPDLVVPLLGHVLAHEIVHILSGTDSHTESGLMKRHWSQSDLNQMLIRPLPFLEPDLLLLDLGIRNRDARLAAMRNKISVLAASAPKE